jgi:hypothetical protein
VKAYLLGHAGSPTCFDRILSITAFAAGEA